METPQNTFEEIIVSENALVLSAEERYGEYYTHALDFAEFLGNFLRSVDPDRYIFAMFLSQIRKHTTLALFSSVRLHHTQAMMDMRQVLEAGACAAYAIANTDIEDFADITEDGILEPTQALTNKRYNWLDQNYKAGSDAIKNLKGQLNKFTSHANIVTAHSNFNFNQNTGRFETPFFDADDDYLTKTNLWMIGNVVLGLTDLFYGVSVNSGGIAFSDNFHARLQELKVVNDRLKAEMMATQRYKDAAARATN